MIDVRSIIKQTFRPLKVYLVKDICNKKKV